MVVDDKMTTGCPPSDFQNASGPAVNPLNHQWPAPSQLDLDEPVSGSYYFWSFLTKTKQDQALPSHVHGENWPHSTQFWLVFFSFSQFFWDTLYVRLQVHFL